MVDYTSRYNLPKPTPGDSVLPQSRDFINLANTVDSQMDNIEARRASGDVEASRSFDVTGALTSMDNLDQVNQDTLYYIQEGSKPATAPAGARSGFVWTRVADSGAFVRLQTYTEVVGDRRSWSRGRSGSNPGSWTTWKREDPAGALVPSVLTSASGSLDGINTDTYHYVWSGDAPLGTPAPVSGFVQTQIADSNAYVRRQTFSEVGTGRRIWSRSRSGSNPGSWSHWEMVARDVKTHPVYLTRPLGPSNTDSATARAVRIPFRVPARAHRWRLVFRNLNHRGHDTPFPGAVTMRTVTVGDGLVGDDNLPNGSFGTGSTAFPSGRRVLVRNIYVDNLASEWATAWVTGSTLEPGREYLMSYGYQTDGQPVHSAMAGAWFHSSADTAEWRELPEFSTRSNRAPFDVRLEIAVDAETPTQIVIGDSISAGSNAAFPVRDAPANLASAAGASQPLPNLHAFGGAYIIEWYSGVFGDLTENKWIDAMRYGKHDRVVLAMGSNDIHDGTSLAVMKSRYTNLIKIVQERLSPNVVACAITPRTRWATDQPEKEVVRRQFNEWLSTLPEGIVACVDVASAVTADDGKNLLAGTDAGDGIHFTTLGSALMGQALASMARPVTTERTPRDTGWRSAFVAPAAVTSGDIEVSRWGPMVSLSFRNVVLAAGTGAVVLGSIPVGFRPRQDVREVGWLGTSASANTTERINVNYGTDGGVIFWGGSGTTSGGTRPTAALDGTMVWRTDDPVPL